MRAPFTFLIALLVWGSPGIAAFPASVCQFYFDGFRYLGDDFFEAVKLASDEERRRLRDIISNSPRQSLDGFRDAVRENKIPPEKALTALLHPSLQGNLPSLNKAPSQWNGYSMLVRALNGELDSNARAWANFNWEEIGSKAGFQELGEYLRQFSNAPESEIRLAGDLSLLWYPKYPDAPVSFTHAKIIVDDQVWSTMQFYKKWGTREAHERLARRSLKDGYYEFKIQASEDEVARVKYLVETNDQRALGGGNCSQGACGAINEAGALLIPSLFHQVPSLTALYFATRRLITPGKVLSIRYHGKSALQNTLSFDLMLEGAVVSTVSYGAAQGARSVSRKLKEDPELIPSIVSKLNPHVGCAQLKRAFPRIDPDRFFNHTPEEIESAYPGLREEADRNRLKLVDIMRCYSNLSDPGSSPEDP